MRFICDYIELELEKEALLRRLKRQPFVRKQEYDQIRFLADERHELFQQTLVPYFGQGKGNFLESSDLTYLYSQENFRLQICFQYYLKLFQEKFQKAQPSQGDAGKVKVSLKINAQEAVLRRNDGLVSVALNPNLMNMLSQSAPKLATSLAQFSEDTKTLPHFLGRDENGFYDVVVDAYKSMGIELDKHIANRARSKAKVYAGVQTKAEDLSRQVFHKLDKYLVRGAKPRNHPS